MIPSSLVAWTREPESTCTQKKESDSDSSALMDLTQEGETLTTLPSLTGIIVPSSQNDPLPEVIKYSFKYDFPTKV